ncbi:penicillin-binding protein 2 [Acetivibrio clariflavus]|uniref:Penicillin-binding protein 2 n=1 Tax=Acetivibrio clariflavus (strain DSM 19732 / NBRC 101661 / EBR45) TaxID=720554 RepID=G8LY59_ACECE|nr:penicillin-binding protein 2 [Acetivibrio clariflavus]AEV67790.1 penicillin-binding protein 2 [Acetivibrio clariflavus DSM 19732]
MEKRTNEKKSNERFVLLAIMYLLVFTIIVVQLINLQIINGKENDEKSQQRLLQEREIVAPRGIIADTNGIPIATNRVGYTIHVAKTNLKGPQLNEMIIKLIRIIESNGDTFESGLPNYLTFNPIDFGKNIKDSEKALQKWKSEMVLKEKEIELLNTPEDVFKYFREKKFDIDAKYTDEEAYKIMCIRYDMLIKGYTATNPLLIAKDVGIKTVAQIEERSHEFPGVQIDVEPVRKYVDAQDFAHVLGFIGLLSEEQYESKKDAGYKLNDIIGKAGIERAAENYLRGINGKKRVEVDTSGRLTSELSSEPAIPGNNVYLTIDSRLQKVAMESLERNIADIRSRADYRKNFGDANAGAVVAIDVNSGAILAMASYPTYDPSVFLPRTDVPDAAKKQNEYLNDSKNKPMLNRAIGGVYTPGSIYKPLTAIAALEENAITPDTAFYCKGYTEQGGMRFRCMGVHGRVNLNKGLEVSCNVYFQEIGVKTGIDKIDKWVKSFGLGELTGIEIPAEEAKGMRANRETKMEYRNDVWRPADTAQVSIGQFDNMFTPIQIANYVSTLANGGKRYKPYIIKSVKKYDGSIVMETKPEYETVPVSQKTIEAIKAGMIQVSSSMEGTAAAYFRDFPFTVASKTGTPETGLESQGKSSNGLFIAYAPAEKPEIAIAVVVEHGVWGSYAVPIAKDVLREYFGLNGDKTNDDQIAVEEVKFTR